MARKMMPPTGSGQPIAVPDASWKGGPEGQKSHLGACMRVVRWQLDFCLDHLSDLSLPEFDLEWRCECHLLIVIPSHHLGEGK